MTWAAENRAWRERAAKHWAPRASEPLRLRAWLGAPVTWDGYDPLTVEGAIQYLVIALETGRIPDDVYYGCPVTAPLQDTDVQIPIVDTDSFGTIPIALASCGIFSPGAVASVRWRRTRPRADYYGVDRVKVSTADMKAHNIPAATVIARYLDFYVVGDRELLKRLLRDVTELGSRRGGGLGRIHGWEVTEHADWSLYGPGGQLMRTLPRSAGEEMVGADLRECTLRAPYWHPRTRGLGWVPTQRLGSQEESCA